MTDEDFIRGLRDADAHRGGIRCLRLFRLEPSYFDSVRAEVSAWSAARPPRWRATQNM